MAARVTMSLTEDGQFELLINEEGRDLLVHELRALNKNRDHFHLMSHEWGSRADVDLSVRAYRPTDKIISSAKVLFRPDDWDREHFPHVMPTHE